MASRGCAYLPPSRWINRTFYTQPLTGRPPVQLTQFNIEPMQVIAVAWSPDGKKIALTRQRYRDTDVVMFTGFR